MLGGEYVKAALVLAGTEERVGESVVAPEYPALVVYQRHRQRKAHQSLVVGVVDGFVQPVVVRIFIQAYLEQLAQRKPRNQDKQRQGYPESPGLIREQNDIHCHKADHKRQYQREQNIAPVKILQGRTSCKKPLLRKRLSPPYPALP